MGGLLSFAQSKGTQEPFSRGNAVIWAWVQGTLILSLNTLWRYLIDFNFSNVNGCSSPDEAITSSRTVVQTWGCRAKLKNSPLRPMPVASREGKKRLMSWSRRNLRSVVSLISSETTEKGCDIDFMLILLLTPFPGSPSSSVLAVALALALACSVNARSMYLSTKLCTCATARLHSACWVARPYRKDMPASAILRSTPDIASSKDVRNRSASNLADSGSSVSGDSPKRNSVDESKNCIPTPNKSVRFLRYDWSIRGTFRLG